MSELDYIYARVSKALLPRKAKAVAQSTEDFMRSAAGQRLKATQAHNAFRESNAATQRASNKATSQRWAAGSAARTKAGDVNLPSRKAPPPRYRGGGDRGAGPGWIGGGNS